MDIMSISSRESWLALGTAPYGRSSGEGEKRLDTSRASRAIAQAVAAHNIAVFVMDISFLIENYNLIQHLHYLIIVLTRQ
jgi:hypothetical protein